MGVKAGLKPSQMCDIINAGSGRNSATQDKFPKSVISRSFDFGFATGLSHKDVRLCLQEADELGVPMVAGAAGNKTVTATFSTAPTFWSVIACEITGHDSGDVFEAQAANYQAALGTGTDNITSGTVTPAANGAFLFGWHGNLNGKSSTVGTGWTQRQTNAFWAGASQTLEQGTAGAQASLRNCTAADGNWLSVVMAANAAGGGGGAPALNVGSIGEPVVGGSVF
jgi:hypothetical protein